MIIESEKSFAYLSPDFRDKIMKRKTNREEVVEKLNGYGILYLEFCGGDRLDKVAAKVFGEFYKTYFEKAKKENYDVSNLPETLEELTK
jgi:hypothetical protein